MVILAQGSPIDGVGRILGQAGPTQLRPQSAGVAAFLPAKGKMTFDTADLKQMEQDGTLNDVITHEMGHVLGIGTVWTFKSLLKGAGKTNPTFLGKAAMKEFGLLKGPTVKPTPVPVENTGGPGTADSHWRETVFRNEMMTGFVGVSGNPLSRMTVASLQDLGYVVDLNAAEPYSLPNLLVAGRGGTLGGPGGERRAGHRATQHPHPPARDQPPMSPSGLVHEPGADVQWPIFKDLRIDHRNLKSAIGHRLRPWVRGGALASAHPRQGDHEHGRFPEAGGDRPARGRLGAGTEPHPAGPEPVHPRSDPIAAVLLRRPAAG